MKKISKADLLAYRNFLLPLWLAAHQSWDSKKIPSCPSLHMCRYTTLFLYEVIKKYHDLDAVILTGCPDEDVNATANGLYGIKDKNGRWHDHSWIVVDDSIIDLTADQFGYAPIIQTLATDQRYRHSPNQVIFMDSFESLRVRSNIWVDLYGKEREKMV
jgi:hypothetical protein